MRKSKLLAFLISQVCLFFLVSKPVFAEDIVTSSKPLKITEEATGIEKSPVASLRASQVKSQSLIDIYHQALANDATLASAISANQAAQEIVEQGRALYRPTINLSADVSASKTNIQYNGGINPFMNAGNENFEGYSYGVDARQPIYRKQNLVQIEQTKTQVSQADKQLLLSKQDLILRTTQAYFDVLIAQDKIDLFVAQKLSISSQLEQANANFEVGTATITDVNESQARYDLIVAQEIAAVNDYEVAKRSLQAIIGEDPKKLATVKSDLKTSNLELGMNKWIEVAAQNNLNVQIQQDVVKFSQQEIERSKAGHLPTLDAVASYSDSYANGSASGFGSDLKNGTVGLQLQIPL